MCPPERKRKHIVISTAHCKSELDTIQYVINKQGFREATNSNDGNLIWYGMALRDNDIDYLKAKKVVLNRFPLMDVSQTISLTL